MKQGKVSKHKEYTDDAREALLKRLPLDARGRVSWRRLAAELGVDDKSRGYLSQVASGKRKASNALRLRLGLHPLHVTVAPLACGCPPTGKRCPVHQPKSTRKPDPVVRVARVDAARIAALSALYAQRGIGEARYRVGLKRESDAIIG